MGFSRREYWSGLPFPSPGDLPDLGIEPRSPALRQTLYPLSHQGSPKSPIIAFLYFHPSSTPVRWITLTCRLVCLWLQQKVLHQLPTVCCKFLSLTPETINNLAPAYQSLLCPAFSFLRPLLYSSRKTYCSWKRAPPLWPLPEIKCLPIPQTVLYFPVSKFQFKGHTAKPSCLLRCRGSLGPGPSPDPSRRATSPACPRVSPAQRGHAEGHPAGSPSPFTRLVPSTAPGTYLSRSVGWWAKAAHCDKWSHGDKQALVPRINHSHRRAASPGFSLENLGWSFNWPRSITSLE